MVAPFAPFTVRVRVYGRVILGGSLKLDPKHVMSTAEALAPLQLHLSEKNKYGVSAHCKEVMHSTRMAKVQQGTSYGDASFVWLLEKQVGPK
jgi:hypothetical protein